MLARAGEFAACRPPLSTPRDPRGGCQKTRLLDGLRLAQSALKYACKRRGGPLLEPARTAAPAKLDRGSAKKRGGAVASGGRSKCASQQSMIPAIRRRTAANLVGFLPECLHASSQRVIFILNPFEHLALAGTGRGARGTRRVLDAYEGRRLVVKDRRSASAPPRRGQDRHSLRCSSLPTSVGRSKACSEKNGPRDAASRGPCHPRDSDGPRSTQVIQVGRELESAQEAPNRGAAAAEIRAQQSGWTDLRPRVPVGRPLSAPGTAACPCPVTNAYQ